VLLLTSASDKLRLATSSTANIDVHASYVDYAAGTIAPARTNTTISSATTTDIVAAPAGSTQRNVKHVNIRNRHASTSNDITVIHTDGTNAMELFKCTLAPGEQLLFNDGSGFQVFDSAGALKKVATFENTSWTAYTPVATPVTGAFTTVTCTGRYKVVGKSVFVQISVSIVTNGTAATGFAVTLPFTAASNYYTMAIAEVAATGFSGRGIIQTPFTSLEIKRYDNAYLGGTGYQIVAAGVYEIP
jgi:hypothetical protein